MEYAEVDRY